MPFDRSSRGHRRGSRRNPPRREEAPTPSGEEYPFAGEDCFSPEDDLFSAEADLFTGEEPADPLLYARDWGGDFAGLPEGDAFAGGEYADVSGNCADDAGDHADDAVCAGAADDRAGRSGGRDAARLRRGALRRSAPFFAALLALTVLSWALPLRPRHSELEQRDLEEFPPFSLSALLSGDWFDGIDRWFSDTFPLRERWVEAQNSFSELYGDRTITFSGSLGGVTPPSETEVPAATPIPTPAEEAPPAESTPPAEVTAAPEPETTPEPVSDPSPDPAPTPDPASGVVFDPNAARQINAAIYFGDSAYEVYNLGRTAAEEYSRVLSKAADRYAGQCRLFSIICPNSGGIVLSYDIYDQLYLIRQGEAIEHFYTNKSDNLIPVYIYDTLRAHNSEYLYFRTDHHWTALAAWYAYEQWCEAAGFTPVPLSEYTEHVFPGFLGSYYRTSLNKDMAANPDTVYAYDPPGNITARSHAMGGNWVEHGCVVDKSGDSYEKKYLSFLNGDHYVTEIINNDIEDDSACLVIKDSYANPFVIYLSQHYHTVVVRDWHYDNPVSPIVKEYGIDDIIVLTELVQAQGNDMLTMLTGDFAR